MKKGKGVHSPVRRLVIECKNQPHTMSTLHDPITHSTRFNSAAAERDPRVRDYWRDGYVALRGLFGTEEIAAWSAECDRLLHSDLVQPHNVRTPFRFNSGNAPERIDPVLDISPIFAGLINDPRILTIVEAIFQDTPLLFKDKLIFKAPGTDGYSMHQDQAWWQMCSADDMLSVSIQVDGATAANGCIELFPGYHDRLLTPAGTLCNFRAEERAQVDLSKGEKIETQPGDVLIFHSLAPHQSSTNLANVSRRSLYLTFSAARVGDLYREHLEKYISRSSKAEEMKGQAFFK